MNKRSKFNVNKETQLRSFDGIIFDSALEMKYYKDVILDSISNGEIKHFELQKKYVLQPSFKKFGKTVLPIEYKADFFVVFADGTERVIDIKGCADSVAKLKRKMFWFVYPNIDYVWYGYSLIDGGWVSYEKIQCGRSARKRAKKQNIKEI